MSSVEMHASPAGSTGAASGGGSYESPETAASPYEEDSLTRIRGDTDAPDSATPVMSVSMDSDQLTSVEAVMAYALLEQLMERLGLLGVVTVDANTQAQELSRTVGEEISRVMEEQKGLESKFESLIQARTALQSMPNKSKFKENQEQLQIVSVKLRETTMTLRRTLKDNPNISDNMLKSQTERIALQMLLAEVMEELQRGRFTILTERLKEIEARERLVSETIEREREASSAVRQLRQQIQSEKAEHAETMATKRRVLQTIKEDLKQVKSRTKTELKYRINEVTAQNECSRRLFESQVGDFESRIGSLEKQLEVENKVHTANISFLEKYVTSLQEQALKWDERLTTDSLAKDRDIENLKQEKIRIKERVTQLEQKYQQELAEQEARATEKRRQADARYQYDVEMERRDRAARKIQMLYRVYLSKKESTKKTKKSKKDGKKSKKK